MDLLSDELKYALESHKDDGKYPFYSSQTYSAKLSFWDWFYACRLYRIMYMMVLIESLEIRELDMAIAMFSFLAESL